MKTKLKKPVYICYRLTTNQGILLRDMLKRSGHESIHDCARYLMLNKLMESQDNKKFKFGGTG